MTPAPRSPPNDRSRQAPGRSSANRQPQARRPVGWSLIFAGLLAGGALSFAAGLITGTQMTAVAYRGALPDRPATDPPAAQVGGRPDGAARQNSATPNDTPHDTPNDPRARQVAAGPDAPATPAPSTAATDTLGPPAPDPAATGRALVNLPERGRWPGSDRARATADPSAVTPAARSQPPSEREDAAPPPPLPKPESGAPQRLTPMRAPAPASPPGGDAVQPGAADPLRTPIWQVAAPTDEPGERWHLAAPRLDASANWQTSSLSAAIPLPPPIPPARAAAPDRATPGPQSTSARQIGGYSVQVGAFRDRANALAQAARVSASGYAPRIVHTRATQSRLFMVRLGAFADRSAADAVARQIAQDLNVETWPVAD